MSFQPLPAELITQCLNHLGFNPRRLAIRELVKLANDLEEAAKLRFIRMEFGIPNLPTPQVAIEAECRAIRECDSQRIYPPFDGIPELKQAGVRFIKDFLNIELPPEVIIPTCGAMQGGFVSQVLGVRMLPGRDTVLFLDPGFPVNRLQARFFGLKAESVDFYDFRGEKLVREVERRVSQGHIGSVIWSSPNNPAWVCLTQEELDGLAEVSNKHDVLLIEDMAYFGMDLRQDYLTPGREPYVPTVAHKGKNWVMLLSGSKLFSFAGSRVGVLAIAPELAHRRFPALEEHYATTHFLHAFIHGGIYSSTAGVNHGGQYGLAALLNAACEGETSFRKNVEEYSGRAKWLKECFLRHGFKLVYDNDLGEPIGDGFYFTVSYPGFDGPELLLELLRYGVSMITLQITGSTRSEGLRACVSFTDASRFAEMEERLAAFALDHPEA